MSGRPSWPRGPESTTSSDRGDVHDRDHAPENASPEDASPEDAGENDAMLSRATIVHLRRQVRALQQSATRYRSLVDLSTDATYELSLEPGSSPPLPPTPPSHPADHAAPAPTAEVGAAVEVADAGPEADPGGVGVRVIDTGSGIGDDFLPHLFDTFKQESEGLQRSHEGSGLGLAITKRLVDHLGGDITVESKKGEGSTFTVTFPRADASSGAFYQDAQPL